MTEPPSADVAPMMLISLGETEAKEVAVLSDDAVTEQENARKAEERRKAEEERKAKAKMEAELLWRSHDYEHISKLADCNATEREYLDDLLHIKLNLAEEGEMAAKEEAALKEKNRKLLEESEW